MKEAMVLHVRPTEFLRKDDIENCLSPWHQYFFLFDKEYNCKTNTLEVVIQKDHNIIKYKFNCRKNKTNVKFMRALLKIVLIFYISTNSIIVTICQPSCQPTYQPDLIIWKIANHSQLILT